MMDPACAATEDVSYLTMAHRKFSPSGRAELHMPVVPTLMPEKARHFLKVNLLVSAVMELSPEISIFHS